MATNWNLALHVLSRLRELGVKELVLCPGARNAPLVVAASEHKESFQIWTHFEERSASFFALGRIRATGKPVAVLVTSGTAVAELLPAVIEARYSGAFLIVVTADRPRELRFTGAPQTIPQLDLFKPFVDEAFDLANDERLPGVNKLSLSRRAPVQINVCFREPLLDKDCNLPEEQPPQGAFMTPRNPLVYVGPLSSLERDYLKGILPAVGCDVWAEKVSGLPERRESPRVLPMDEDFLSHLMSSKTYDGFVRLGAIPTCRFWRDLEEKFSNLPVFHFSNNPYPGLSRGKVLPLESFADFSAQSLRTSDRILDDYDLYLKQIKALHERYPLSEPSWMRRISAWSSKANFVYIGNSLPIREWNNYALPRQGDYGFNRGCNGIDGQVSSFLGQCPSGQSWGIFGDLTFLYDLAGPWVLEQLKSRSDILHLRFVVIHNGGGKIFQPMFANRIFENPHELSFEPQARFWGLNYVRIESEVDVALTDSDYLLEVVPDTMQTELFLEEKANLKSSLKSGL